MQFGHGFNVLGENYIFLQQYRRNSIKMLLQDQVCLMPRLKPVGKRYDTGRLALQP